MVTNLETVSIMIWKCFIIYLATPDQICLPHSFDLNHVHFYWYPLVVMKILQIRFFMKMLTALIDFLVLCSNTWVPWTNGAQLKKKQNSSLVNIVLANYLILLFMDSHPTADHDSWYLDILLYYHATVNASPLLDHGSLWV